MVSFPCWWKEGVIYQIYPRSFQDSNHDGIGDLQGIISKLDYLSWLGISGIWLSPIYISPMFDFGYDISDYTKIDPIFGSVEDVKELLSEAHKRNIHVIFDMVLNHTSSKHQWFIASSSSKENDKRDFYIWRDGKKNKPPNNWYAAFGGRAWTFDKTTGQYYLHSFLKEQPDLNWRNEDMVSSLFSQMAYWLDMGVDGFRLDVINLIVKDKELRDNPWGWGGRPRPYDLQKHIYDRDQAESHIALQKFRSWVDTYENRMLVGEIMVEKPGNPELAASYLGSHADELHLSFDFSFTNLPWDAKKWKEAAQRWYRAIPKESWPTWVLSNHDVKRAFSRYKESFGRARVCAAFLLTQRGTPFIYYGEEIGLPERPVAKKDIQDPLGKWYWPFHKGRDGARRPMVWDTSPYGGFSTIPPWLPPYDSLIMSLSEQQEDAQSLINHYRDLIQIRNHDSALRLGNLTWVEIPKADDVLAYIRGNGIDRRLILLNFSHKTVTFDAYPVQKAMDSNSLRVMYSSIAGDVSVEESAEILSLQPYQALICSAD